MVGVQRTSRPGRKSSVHDGLPGIENCVKGWLVTTIFRFYKAINIRPCTLVRGENRAQQCTTATGTGETQVPEVKPKGPTGATRTQ